MIRVGARRSQAYAGLALQSQPLTTGDARASIALPTSVVATSRRPRGSPAPRWTLDRGSALPDARPPGSEDFPDSGQRPFVDDHGGAVVALTASPRGGRE